MLRPVGTLCLLSGLATAPAAAESAGVDLATRIESAPSREAHDELVAEVDSLSPEEAAAFVAWARARREERGWRRLGPALARLGTRRAISELGAALADGGETAPRALAALSDSPDAGAVPHLVRALPDASRGLRASIGRELSSRLAARPAAVDALARAVIGDESPELAAALAPVVAAGVAGASELAPFDRALGSAPALGPGVARGVAERVAGVRAARPGGDAPEEFAAWRRRLYAAKEAGVALLAKSLSEAPTDADAQTARAVYAALPAVLDRLDADWADRLIADLEHPERPVRDAAWRALLAITGEELPQAQVAWEAWWEEETR